MNHVYGEHQWHSEYQRLCRTRSTESLVYIQNDCWQAANAMPDNPKASQYWDEFWYCRDELRRRAR